MSATGALEIDIPASPSPCFTLSGFETPSIGQPEVKPYALAPRGMPRLLIQFGGFDQGHPFSLSLLPRIQSSLDVYPMRVPPFLPFHRLASLRRLRSVMIVALAGTLISERSSETENAVATPLRDFQDTENSLVNLAFPIKFSCGASRAGVRVTKCVCV